MNRWRCNTKHRTPRLYSAVYKVGVHVLGYGPSPNPMTRHGALRESAEVRSRTWPCCGRIEVSKEIFLMHVAQQCNHYHPGDSPSLVRTRWKEVEWRISKSVLEACFGEFCFFWKRVMEEEQRQWTDMYPHIIYPAWIALVWWDRSSMRGSGKLWP